MMVSAKKSCTKVILINLIWFLIHGIYILLKNRPLGPPIPCMEKGRLLPESHPSKVTQKGRNNQIPTAFSHL